MSHLRRLWAGMLTHDTLHSGTRDPIVLIVNENGIDRLHHTFPGNYHYKAELFELNVAANHIVPENLNNSSFRVGIRNDDKWRPEHIVIWGERFGAATIVPLAFETGLAGISTDASEGNTSVPIRLVALGDDDMPIRQLLMLMTTAGEDAATDAPINLQITSEGQPVVDFDCPDTPQEDQEWGEANLYFAPVIAPFTKHRLAKDAIRLSIKDDDAWLPASFFLFGLDDATGRPEALVPLVHLRTWSLGWLSTDSSEGLSSVTLPQV